MFRNALVSRTRVLPAPFILRAGLSGRSWAFGLTLLIVSYLVIVPLITLLYASIKSTEDKLPFETTATTLANYALVFSSPSDLAASFEHIIVYPGLPRHRAPAGDHFCVAARTNRGPRTDLDCESHPRADDDSIVTLCHCVDPAIGSADRTCQRGPARRAGAERRHGTVGYLFARRHVLRAGTTARAFRLSDDRGLVSCHGSVVGRAERHGGTQCRRKPL